MQRYGKRGRGGGGQEEDADTREGLNTYILHACAYALFVSSDDLSARLTLRHGCAQSQ